MFHSILKLHISRASVGDELVSFSPLTLKGRLWSCESRWIFDPSTECESERVSASFLRRQLERDGRAEIFEIFPFDSFYL